RVHARTEPALRAELAGRASLDHESIATARLGEDVQAEPDEVAVRVGSQPDAVLDPGARRGIEPRRGVRALTDRPHRSVERHADADRAGARRDRVVRHERHVAQPELRDAVVEATTEPLDRVADADPEVRLV